MANLFNTFSRYLQRQHLKKIRARKPSLIEYYAMYLANKKLKELNEEDIERAEEILIPLILKYYLNPELKWEKVTKNLLQDLMDFYLYFCKRKKRPDVPLEDYPRLLKGEYSLEELLQWCRSPVPRTPATFRSVLKRTQVRHVLMAVDISYVSKDEVFKTYHERREKLIPEVKRAIEGAFDIRVENETKKSTGKQRVGMNVFSAYLEVSGLRPSSYLQQLEIEHEFKIKLLQLWFTSKNRHERLEKIEEAFPGLVKLVSYTGLWEYVRSSVDEFILLEALSDEEIANYLERNRWRMSGRLKEKFERALELLEKSYREKT